MKVIFMGTPDFAVGTLQEIVKAGHEVLAVITQPDKPKGRGKALAPTPVKKAAEELGLTVWQPVKVREEEFINKIQELSPDAIVVVAFGQLIPKRLLDIPKYGCVNVHASLLPKYRGAAPIQWAVIDGEEKSGVTIMHMDEGLDTGDMIAVRELTLDKKETGGSLFDKLSVVGAQLLVETLPDLEEKLKAGEKQPQESTTPYARMIDKKMGNIDWSQSAVTIDRLVRGLNPWPSAYTFLNGKMLKIWDCTVGKERKKAKPGTIIEIGKHSFAVACGEGNLEIQEVQLEGKKRMDVNAFLRGYTLAIENQLTRTKE